MALGLKPTTLVTYHARLPLQILTDCSRSIGLYQNELLQEVARVMAKPAKPETDAGRCARRSAKELLRKYGQAGTTAFRAVHNEPRRAGGAAIAVQGGGYGLAGYTPPIGYPPQGYPGSCLVCVWVHFWSFSSAEGIIRLTS